MTTYRCCETHNPSGRTLSEADRRMNVESRLLAVISNYGGQQIVASPAMDRMVAELADAVDELARDGRFLPDPSRSPSTESEKP